ncbi:pyridoxamine 5'-phosphate oxidase [Nocardiopsis gilva YIM 90087]|uniref:Pyridoxamine 5'-phosphate oxidase n=1 Tax=Nocardiopsis gilva YIM 90087 TaxID=1235441 RepID=A0A223SAE6_9ACTN|nr:pyridoxamine 5'-phosphate oxidase family protein [Nocardiopsis gilva]ASU85098.1 pyridoxamine 5'-phosphate oxidase [Nocardiopsis gilva YIM 90087]
MTEPRAARPFMPGYGVQGPDAGGGLLPWSWAEERLRESHDYWVSSVWPDGRPHTMPVWGVWDAQELWFRSARRSRKVRNLRLDPRISVATCDARRPVVVEGRAAFVTEDAVLDYLTVLFNAKYRTRFTASFLDPAVCSTVRVRPHWVFALDMNDFDGSPTRWKFDTD